MNLRSAAKGQGRIVWAVLVTAFFLNLTVGGIQEARTATATEQEKEAARSRREKLEQLEKLSKPQTKPSTEEEKTAGEIKAERESAMVTQLLLEEKKSALKAAATSEEEKAAREELERLEKELLHFPKRDRFSFGGDFDLTYDNNVNRNSIHHEKGDTLFNINPFVNLDLGGKKTNLRAEYRWQRKYNAKVSEGRDTTVQELTVRSGRKIGKRTTLSLNDRLTRESLRIQGIDDGNKIRWDNSHRASLNYELNRKLSFNFDADYANRYFSHENFDQDGDWQFSLEPSVSFQMRPKTRFNFAYSWRTTQIKTKASDATTHLLRVGYFGKITGKSSLQADFSQSFQDPDSAQASSSNQTTSSLGYIWKMTPKTSLRVLYSNTFTLTLSDSVSGVNLSKTESRSRTNALSLSVRFRPYRKLSTEFSFDGSHTHTKTKKTATANARTGVFTFPFQLAADYELAKWLRLRFSYTFQYQYGNEKSDENRAHTWFVGTNWSF